MANILAVAGPGSKYQVPGAPPARVPVRCNIMRDFDSVRASRAPSLHHWTPYAGNGSKLAS